MRRVSKHSRRPSILIAHFEFIQDQNLMSVGKCLCGEVSWELEPEAYATFNCHCKMCRKAHGTPFGFPVYCDLTVVDGS